MSLKWYKMPIERRFRKQKEKQNSLQWKNPTRLDIVPTLWATSLYPSSYSLPHPKPSLEGGIIISLLIITYCFSIQLPCFSAMRGGLPWHDSDAGAFFGRPYPFIATGLEGGPPLPASALAASFFHG